MMDDTLDLGCKLVITPEANLGRFVPFFKLVEYRDRWRNVAGRAPADC